MNAQRTNYDSHPVVVLKDEPEAVWLGWESIVNKIRQAAMELPGTKKWIALECYHGVNDQELVKALKTALPGNFYPTASLTWPEEKIEALKYPDVTDDEIFGYITRLQLIDFFDPEKIQHFQNSAAQSTEEYHFVYGPGASLVAGENPLLVYFDMPRWEIQLRFRRNEIGNLWRNNATQKTSLQYKEAFFVDWRACDKLKKNTLSRWNLVVDSTLAGQPKMVTGTDYRKALAQASTQPFRLVPFFDPGPWGGQWIKKHCNVDPSPVNYAWAFDCVPEENSLLLKFGDLILETPAINLVFAFSKPLLGEAVQARFGDEFPIRFDFLDTMDGGNLSLQVHPDTDFIFEEFGMRYTQDESYYFLDAADDAIVYLGLKDDTNPEEMITALQEAQDKAIAFDADRYVNKWPVKQHDHVLIPAGTIHCSGKNSMVLEISATPYIFTFKLWDWGRMGLDGKPRPINIDRGRKVLDWSRRTESTRSELINAVTELDRGTGWVEERTGLHEREFIETRRHWFSGKVIHQTQGSVNVLNLVSGKEAIVESPDHQFDPFIVHYAETFVIPEKVKTYSIRPYGESEGSQCATIKAFVRTNP